jgi:hypothetical protein
MAEENTQPYFRSKPGDLWTAEIWNDTQVKIKEDIETKVRELKDEIDNNGVKFSLDAEKFAGKTPMEWATDIDKKCASRFALGRHYHIGNTYFRRYSKKRSVSTITNSVGFIPQVDLYILMGIREKFKLTDEYKIVSNDGKDPKFLLYREDIKISRFRSNGWSRPFLSILDEYGVRFIDDDTLNDVRTRLWEKIFRGETDIISHGSSQPIEEDCAKNITIGTLRKSDQLSNIFLLFCPVKKDTVQPIIFFGYGEITVGFDLKNLNDDEVIDVMIMQRF